MRRARLCTNERGTWPGHGPLWVSVCMSTEQPTRPRVLIILLGLIGGEEPDLGKSIWRKRDISFSVLGDKWEKE